MPALLALDHLDVTHGSQRALHGVSLGVPQGRIVTILGENGAGKSTLLHAVIGALPCSGSIVFDGRPIEGFDLEARVRLGLSLVPQQRELFGGMSVEDNLRLGRFHRSGSSQPMLREVFALFPRLQERRRGQAGTLSGGEQQMLAIGRALMGEPRLLMLDEPSLGLAPQAVSQILRAVVALRDNGLSVLLVEQNARAALRIADHGVLLEHGRVALEGSPEDIAADGRIVEAYLGLRGATA
ncbi:ABC transporter ATP-binding protein [Teichococcus vastitatis]|jgi:branched-chain amino acid transport system ATP-binding protein|uniref:ABC transporter ATP-binding protein n=1 Tax=Teichococcus vastitatis TaxID=2307076 RepID=A0ABS9W8Q1_9PROT|nr:ABC transporter ATP-binding protein [Pseudoroseomonas vastitatis]MCI0755290.1 ABC transporter ATP-binding protein [Pseudoroseomonas vastitatis]